MHLQDCDITEITLKLLKFNKFLTEVHDQWLEAMYNDNDYNTEHGVEITM